MNDPDWAPTLKLGHNKVKSPSNDDVDRCRRVSERATKRACLQEEIASKSQIVSVLSVDETIVEKEPTCTLNSSGTEFEVLEQIHEDSEEFPGSIGCETEWPSADKECQTDLSMAQIYQLEECNRNLFTELSEVKNKLVTSDLSQSGFEGNDENLILHWHSNIFNAYAVVYSCCSPCCQHKYQCIMPIPGIFTSFTTSAVKCSFARFSNRFKASVSTASRVFNRWIDIMRVKNLESKNLGRLCL